MESGRRLPICQGFYIKFSKSGHALNQGLEESEVLPAVIRWLQTHEGNKDYQLVEEWVQQKTKQVEEDLEVQRTRAKRQEINNSVDNAARGSKLNKDLIELVRIVTFQAKGISPKEEE